MNEYRIGYVLSADTLGCIAGRRINPTTNPSFGKMVKISSQDQVELYGIISNIRILDDGLVRQLATTQPIEEHIIRDNRENRIIPLEFKILFIGFRQNDKINHLLPPNPPLSLEPVYVCSNEEIKSFTTAGSSGYLRYLVADKTALNFDLIAAHFQNLSALLLKNEQKSWMDKATRTLIHLYRNDYDTLNALLHTLSDSAVFTK